MKPMENSEVKKLYAERDARKLEPHYSAHVNAMTEEGLYAKSDIAAELAFRDVEIAKLEVALDEALSSTVTPPTEQELLAQLTEAEACALSVFAPNLACLVEREPPSNVEETRAAARIELAVLIRRRR